MINIYDQKNQKKSKIGLDKPKIYVIIKASAWSDGRKLSVKLDLRKVRASQSKVLANGKSRQLEGKCNRK